MVDAEKIGKKRNALGGYIDKVMKDCELWLENIAENKEALVGSGNVLRNKIKIFGELTDSIIDELEDEVQIAKEYEYCGRYEQKVETLIVVINDALDKMSQNRVVNNPATVVNVETKEKRKTDIRLPKLNLKPYDGDPLKWKTFIDTFECAVNKRDDMTNIEKMTYLTSLCEGEAEACIQGIVMSNDNYEIALKMLKERFGDEQILISAHMNKLLNLDATSNFVYIKELRILYNNMEIQVPSLRGIGLEEKDMGLCWLP